MHIDEYISTEKQPTVGGIQFKLDKAGPDGPVGELRPESGPFVLSGLKLDIVD